MIEIADGSRLFLRVDRDRKLLARSLGLEFEGGISLFAGPGSEPERGIRLSIEHLGFVGPGTVVEGRGPTGLISVLGIPNEGGGMISDKGEDTAFVNIAMKALVLYEAVDKRLGFRQKDDRFLSFVEAFTGSLHGSVRSAGGSTEELIVEQGSLNLSYQTGGLGWIRDLAIPLDGLVVSRLHSSPGIIKPRFGLRVRPVGFKISKDDPTPSGSSWEPQLRQAVEIWNHCGIRLDVQEIEYIVDKNLKFSMDVREMRQGWKDPDARTIEVYFSTSDLPDGGGQSVSCGMGSAAIAVTDNNKDLPRLVAHEIGHILNGIHPTDPQGAGEWNGNQDSVLEPLGGPKRLTLLGPDKCGRARNAVLEILT